MALALNKRLNLVESLPGPTRQRLEQAGVDLSNGYPFWPERPTGVALAEAAQPAPFEHRDPGLRADKSKKNLFAAATEIIDLSPHLGTEIVGVQLSQLNDTQRDELALLIAERTVVFFRDQHSLTPQAQRDLGKYFGELEVHPQTAQVPGLPGISIIWDKLGGNESGTHLKQPSGITHLHNDTIPLVGGDTYWASGYAAYDKLSPAFRKLIDGLEAVYQSYHSYEDPKTGERIPIERVHPMVRVHPVTGWKSLFINRKYTVRVVGFEAGESAALLNYLFDVYEKTLDIQLRFKWSPRTSALWDNRVSIHAAVYDYEGKEPRHGTRVSTLAEVPYFDQDAPTRREALGLDKPEDFEQKKGSEY